MDFERDGLAHAAQGLAETVAGDAAADRVELGDEPLYPLAGIAEVDGPQDLFQVRGTAGRTARSLGSLHLRADRAPLPFLPSGVDQHYLASPIGFFRVLPW